MSPTKSSATGQLIWSLSGFVSHIENYWEHPDLARRLLRLGRFARVIMFDKRGTGLSDAVPEVPTLDLRMDDVRAVMDADLWLQTWGTAGGHRLVRLGSMFV